jgi:hypothetical protein
MEIAKKQVIFLNQTSKILDDQFKSKIKVIISKFTLTLIVGNINVICKTYQCFVNLTVVDADGYKYSKQLKNQ